MISEFSLSDYINRTYHVYPFMFNDGTSNRLFTIYNPKMPALDIGLDVQEHNISTGIYYKMLFTNIINVSLIINNRRSINP